MSIVPLAFPQGNNNNISNGFSMKEDEKEKDNEEETLPPSIAVPVEETRKIKKRKPLVFTCDSLE
jgi:hypothetical protein